MTATGDPSTPSGCPPVAPTGRLTFLRGSATVGVGFIISGLAAYGFLAITARTLGPARYAPLAAFWSFTFLVGPGCFSVMEKEIGRQVAAGIATDSHEAPVARRVAEIGLALCVGLLATAVICAPFLHDRLFDGSSLLLVAFMLSIPTMWIQYSAEGVLAGNARFGAYSVMPAGEAGFRLLLGAGLLLLGIRSAGPLGLAIALAPAISATLVIRSLRQSKRRGPFVRRAMLGRSISWLMLGTVGSSILVNSGPIVVKALATPSQQAVAGRFLSGMVLVRVPLFLYNSAAATLLPALAAHAATKSWKAFRRNLNRLVVGLSLVALVTTVGAASVGPSVLTVVFGNAYRLSSTDLAALAGSASALLLATTLSVAMMAARRERTLAGCWALGVAVMALVVSVLPALLERVEMGLLLGSAAACLSMASVVYRRLDLGPTAAHRGKLFSEDSALTH